MNNDCTVYKTADFIGKRWTLLILLELYKGMPFMRYNQIKKSLPGMTSKMLSARLKELEQKGIVKKAVDKTVAPIKCEYGLTRSGLDFINVVKDIKKWALKWNVKNKVCNETDCENCQF